MNIYNETNEIPAISFKNVSKKFADAEYFSVKNVSLDIAQGEFVTIMGTSGSGKTTLLKMVNQLYDITDGDIEFYGKSVKTLDPIQQRRQIGYVIQSAGLFPHMTVEQNIAVVPQILKWDKERIRERVMELLRLLDMDPAIYAKRFPRQLSGGQQQRVGIARALAANPDVLLMDEPFGAIDAITRSALQQELLRLQREFKKTILFVTHDIEEAFLLGDRTLIMDKGELQQFAAPCDIMLHPANEFVSRLVSAGDVVKRIKIITVGSIMRPCSSRIESDSAFFAQDTPIEKAIFTFRGDRSKAMFVTNQQGNIIGEFHWEDLMVLTEGAGI